MIYVLRILSFPLKSCLKHWSDKILAWIFARLQARTLSLRWSQHDFWGVHNACCISYRELFSKWILCSSTDLISGQTQPYQSVFFFARKLYFHLDLLSLSQIPMIWVILKWMNIFQGKVSWLNFSSIRWSYDFRQNSSLIWRRIYTKKGDFVHLLTCTFIFSIFLKFDWQ
jgi:hypothetical protein